MTPEERLLTLYRSMPLEWQVFLIKYAQNLVVMIAKISSVEKIWTDPVKMPIGEYNDT